MKKEKNNEMWTFSWEMWKYPSSLWDKKSGLFHLCCFQLRAICRDRLLMLSQGFLIQHCSILLVYKCVCHAPTIRQIFLKQNKNRSLSQQISLSQQLLFWWGEAPVLYGEVRSVLRETLEKLGGLPKSWTHEKDPCSDKYFKVFSWKMSSKTIVMILSKKLFHFRV